MNIRSLDLKNFRNYALARVEPHPGTNLFYGENAQGKTNILEAVYVCSVSRSHRGGREREMISFGEEEAHLKCELSKRGLSHRVDVHLKKTRPRGVAVDGLPIRHMRQLLGLLHVIIFSPEDLRLIKEEPRRRRRFLDIELCQMDPVYADALTKYQKILNQKNALLKDLYFRPELRDTLPMWQEQQARYARVIIRSRREFLERLNRNIRGIHADISGGREELVLKYAANASETEILKKITEDEEREIRQQKSLSGPQLDDVIFEINGRDVRVYGSQGQQRTAALSLKMAEIDLVRETIHDTPVLLLDDVMSELDEGRQQHLLDRIQGIQTFITCTGMEEIYKKANIDKIFLVKEGNLKEE